MSATPISNRRFVVLSVVLVIVFAACDRKTRDFVYTVPSDSMAPALQTGDVVSGSTHHGPLKRGEIVVFTAPPGASIPSVPDLIKRVVGLPGEKIEGRVGTIYVNDKELPEPYLDAGVRSRDFPANTIPPEHYWVLGDNRQDSRDSTFFKSISIESIKAVITHIDNPATRRGRIPNKS